MCPISLNQFLISKSQENHLRRLVYPYFNLKNIEISKNVLNFVFFETDLNKNEWQVENWRVTINRANTNLMTIFMQNRYIYILSSRD